MRSLKFYHSTFTIDISNGLFSQQITVETQEIMNSLTQRMFGRVYRKEIVFKDGCESHDFARDFISLIEEAAEESWDDAGEFADQVIVDFIAVHRVDIVSYLWAQLDHNQHRGHEYFECGFSEVHGFQEDKVCEHCRPLLSRSVVSE